MGAQAPDRRLLIDVGRLRGTCEAILAGLPDDTAALLIVPPFSDLCCPSLAVHLLQACARQAGHRVGVLYANLLFSALCGDAVYDAIAYSPGVDENWGERLFCAQAYGIPALGHDRGRAAAEATRRHPKSAELVKLRLEELAELESRVGPFCREVGGAVAARGIPVVGATTSFQQTAAAISLLAAVKAASPRTVTLLGGANCQGEMACGVASLSDAVNHVFSGESEQAFVGFLDDLAAGRGPPSSRVVCGQPCVDLDGLPDPVFHEYFAQVELSLPSWRKKPVCVPFESSRGCWWGEKHQCTFCGLNGDSMPFRRKSPDRVLATLHELLAAHPVRNVMATDRIMPHDYVRTLLPRLRDARHGACFFYETKANLSLDAVRSLSDAGISIIQPGVEALSSSLLARMRKGVLARQNVALLRYARCVGVDVNWNLLCDFPGDDPSDYESTLSLIPLLRHLQPPYGPGNPLSLDRFSPYFLHPGDHGISDLRPADCYRSFLPEGADVSRIAYHFQGEYASAHRRDPDLRSRFEAGIAAWLESWNSPGNPLPVLSVEPLDHETFLLVDTRRLADTQEFTFLTMHEAAAALVGGPLARRPLHAWAVERKLAVELDGWSVPLAVSDYETLKSFEVGSLL